MIVSRAQTSELKVEPATVTLKPGEKAKLKVRALRKGNYQGPIAVELKNLPAQVAAAKTHFLENSLSAVFADCDAIQSV